VPSIFRSRHDISPLLFICFRSLVMPIRSSGPLLSRSPGRNGASLYDRSPAPLKKAISPFSLSLSTSRCVSLIHLQTFRSSVFRCRRASRVALLLRAILLSFFILPARPNDYSIVSFLIYLFFPLPPPFVCAILRLHDSILWWRPLVWFTTQFSGLPADFSSLCVPTQVSALSPFRVCGVKLYSIISLWTFFCPLFFFLPPCPLSIASVLPFIMRFFLLCFFQQDTPPGPFPFCAPSTPTSMPSRLQNLPLASPSSCLCVARILPALDDGSGGFSSPSSMECGDRFFLPK